MIYLTTYAEVERTGIELFVELFFTTTENAWSDISIAQNATNSNSDVSFYVEDGISLNEARTSFASSTSPIDRMVRHLIFDTKLPAEAVIRMASATPARMLGIFDRKGSIEVGKDADINLVDAKFNVVKTFCKGQMPGQAGHDE